MFYCFNVLKVRNYLCQLMIVLSMLSCSSQQYENQQTENDQHLPVSSSLSFFENLFLLQQGDILSLTVDAIAPVHIKTLSHDNGLALIDDISVYDNDVLVLKDFAPITAQNIMHLDDNVGLFNLSDPLSSDDWLITVSQNGDLIEALLVSRQFGNNEYRIKRSFTHKINKNYSPDNITFNKSEIALTLEDSRWDTDWIEFPTKGIHRLTYQTHYEIVVTEEGRFRVNE